MVTKQRLDAQQRALGTMSLGVECCVSREGQIPVNENMPVAAIRAVPRSWGEYCPFPAFLSSGKQAATAE